MRSELRMSQNRQQEEFLQEKRLMPIKTIKRGKEEFSSQNRLNKQVNLEITPIKNK